MSDLSGDSSVNRMNVEPSLALPDDAVSAEDFMASTGCTLLDYYKYLGQYKAQVASANGFSNVPQPPKV